MGAFSCFLVGGRVWLLSQVTIPNLLTRGLHNVATYSHVYLCRNRAGLVPGRLHRSDTNAYHLSNTVANIHTYHLSNPYHLPNTVAYGNADRVPSAYHLPHAIAYGNTRHLSNTVANGNTIAHAVADANAYTRSKVA